MVFSSVQDTKTDVIWVIFGAHNNIKLICIDLNNAKSKNNSPENFLNVVLEYNKSGKFVNCEFRLYSVLSIHL